MNLLKYSHLFHPPALSNRSRWPLAFRRGSRKICPIMFLLFGTGIWSFAQAQDLELHELPNISQSDLVSLPKNLARWHMDVSLIHYDETGQQEEISINLSDEFGIGALMSDDETLAYNFNEGPHTLIINLVNYYPLNRLFFLSFSARGTADIAASDILLPIDSRRWTTVGENIPVEPNQRTNYTFPVVQAQFVRINYNITQAGEIASLGLYGEPNLSQAKFQQIDGDQAPGEIPASAETFSFDYASLYSGTEITYLNSGPLSNANLMIDDDSLTYYEFSPQDNQSILVLDLKQETSVNKVSLLYESGPGILEFYLLSSLQDIVRIAPDPLNSSQSAGLDGNGVQDKEVETDRPELPSLASFLQPVSVARGAGELNKVRLPESFFQDNEPIATQIVKIDDERVRIDFEQLLGQYLLIRWLPDTAYIAAGGSDTAGGLKIYEISLFGEIPASSAILNYQALTVAFQTPPSSDTNAPTDIPIQSTPQIPPASQ